MEKRQEPGLNFKPLSEGLGFHPFENGLPYAPSAPKRDYAHGAGAVSAGRPAFAFPPASPKSAAKAAAGTAVKAPLQASVSVTAETATAAPIVSRRTELLPELGWSYLAKRFFAFFIDSFINIALGAAALVGSLWKQGMSPHFFLNSNILLITVSFLLFFNWALITAQEVAFGTSIGKKFFGLSLEGSALATLVRATFFIPSSFFFGLGVLWAVADPNRRGFHDWVSGIQPEEN